MYMKGFTLNLNYKQLTSNENEIGINHQLMLDD